MIKNIVFDLGAVVVDWDPVKLANNYINKEVTPKTLFESGFFEKYWADFDRGVYTEEEIVSKMSEHSGYSLAGCAHLVTYIKHSLVDIPRTVSLIKKLHSLGYNLFCLSNMSNSYYDYLKTREFFNYFHGQIISAHENMIKPEPEIYKLLLNRYNLIPEETLFIDDLHDNVIAAQKEGIQTVHFADKEKGYNEITSLLNLKLIQ